MRPNTPRSCSRSPRKRSDPLAKKQRRKPMTRGIVALAGLFVVGVWACAKDPNDPQTWVSELDDRATLSSALRHIERAGDPKTIKPLGEAWKKHNKQSNILRVMISVAGKKD